MKLYLLVLTLAMSITGIAEEEKIYPDDVLAFIEKRDACNHFRGEEPYSEERRKFINENLTELCVGTDAELAKLKESHSRDELVLKKLSNYETDIETKQ